MKEKVMEIVNNICNNTDTNCRGLEGNLDNAKKLLLLKGVDTGKIKINEIPVNWSSQVVILYQNEKEEYREMFAGIGLDGQFYFDDEPDPDVDMYV
ncbi:hypothetical protein D3C76_1369560 [compost metagenome]